MYGKLLNMIQMKRYYCPFNIQFLKKQYVELLFGIFTISYETFNNREIKAELIGTRG